MGLVVKTLLAFCIGVGLMMGAQTLWLSSVKRELQASPATIPTVQMQPVAKIDPAKFRATLYPKVDPNIGRDAWRGTINRQVSQSINAGRLVPLPPRIHSGVPRR